eukprot:31011-Pelagococcus_subviridis.AAC.8
MKFTTPTRSYGDRCDTRTRLDLVARLPAVLRVSLVLRRLPRLVVLVHDRVRVERREARPQEARAADDATRRRDDVVRDLLESPEGRGSVRANVGVELKGVSRWSCEASRTGVESGGPWAERDDCKSP